MDFVLVAVGDRGILENKEGRKCYVLVNVEQTREGNRW